MTRQRRASPTACETEKGTAPSEGNRTRSRGDHNAGLDSPASLSSEVVAAS